jgi:hypothetical protein
MLNQTAQSRLASDRPSTRDHFGMEPMAPLSAILISDFCNFTLTFGSSQIPAKELERVFNS